ncbi:hypothetical protein Tcan_03099 [Toxocara canis]|uniref:Uncharacterized protein n=1 Tax=Toxocara canis TaxID=6265 RepID=A0A0B2UVJ9_TOXCA|nr:hypothetical protein Tcan_03099 [Toxocara canis]
MAATHINETEFSSIDKLSEQQMQQYCDMQKTFVFRSSEQQMQQRRTQFVSKRSLKSDLREEKTIGFNR